MYFDLSFFSDYVVFFISKIMVIFELFLYFYLVANKTYCCGVSFFATLGVSENERTLQILI